MGTETGDVTPHFGEFLCVLSAQVYIEGCFHLPPVPIFFENLWGLKVLRHKLISAASQMSPPFENTENGASLAEQIWILFLSAQLNVRNIKRSQLIFKSNTDKGRNEKSNKEKCPFLNQIRLHASSSILNLYVAHFLVENEHTVVFSVGSERLAALCTW